MFLTFYGCITMLNLSPFPSFLLIIKPKDSLPSSAFEANLQSNWNYYYYPLCQIIVLESTKVPTKHAISVSMLCHSDFHHFFLYTYILFSSKSYTLDKLIFLKEPLTFNIVLPNWSFQTFYLSNNQYFPHINSHFHITFITTEQQVVPHHSITMPSSE